MFDRLIDWSLRNRPLILLMLVGLIATGGQHENRQAGIGADAPADLEPFEIRQHDVEDYGVRRAAGNVLEA